MVFLSIGFEGSLTSYTYILLLSTVYKWLNAMVNLASEPPMPELAAVAGDELSTDLPHPTSNSMKYRINPKVALSII